jgi:beta-N-acetylhexosaminidase
VIGDLLRGELGFRGLVVTDAMDMGGLAAHFDPGEAAVRAIEAGCDQILYSADTDAAIAGVRAAVASGRLPEGRIDESVERILEAKRFVRESSGGRRASRTSAPDAARRSITLVRDTAGLLPLRSGNVAVVAVSPHGDPLDDALRLLEAGVSVERADVLVLLLALRPKSGAGTIAVPDEIRALAERYARKTIAVSFGSPYILRELGNVSTFVCAWGVQPLLQVAAIEAIRGKREMTGKLPVTIG